MYSGLNSSLKHFDDNLNYFNYTLIKVIKYIFSVCKIAGVLCLISSCTQPSLTSKTPGLFIYFVGCYNQFQDVP